MLHLFSFASLFFKNFLKKVIASKVECLGREEE